MTSKRICCGIVYLLIVIQCLLIMSSSVVAIENTGNIENEVSINSIELKPILSKNVISANEVAIEENDSSDENAENIIVESFEEIKKEDSESNN